VKGNQINLPAIHFMVRKWYIFRSEVYYDTGRLLVMMFGTQGIIYTSLQSWEFVNKAESLLLAFESKNTNTRCSVCCD